VTGGRGQKGQEGAIEKKIAQRYRGVKADTIRSVKREKGKN